MSLLLLKRGRSEHARGVDTGHRPWVRDTLRLAETTTWSGAERQNMMADALATYHLVSQTSECAPDPTDWPPKEGVWTSSGANPALGVQWWDDISAIFGQRATDTAGHRYWQAREARRNKATPAGGQPAIDTRMLSEDGLDGTSSDANCGGTIYRRRRCGTEAAKRTRGEQQTAATIACVSARARRGTFSRSARMMLW